MFQKSIAKVLLIALCLIGSSTSLQAQEVGIIQATATVVSSLSIVGSNNLMFGSVTPGANKSVGRTDIGFAGEWNISGTASSELSLTFTLPDSLIHTSAAVGMPISFNSTDAAYSDGTGSQSAPTAIINPLGPTVARLGAGGQLLVWIGATVTPGISQTGGDYTANVTLTIAYTGN